ncbi:MAG: ParB family chromosome partitioning protein [Chlamydiales bacterium]|jgi:ParB family chromosome partitioning protein
MARRLGRGLESLLGSSTASNIAPGHPVPGPVATPTPANPANPGVVPDSAGPVTTGTLEVPIHKLQPNLHQPRTEWDNDALEELRNSVETHGILQPICVRKRDSGYEIIAGERRWRAARLAGLDVVPVVVRPDVSDRDMLELALVENIQREDLDPIEKAKGYRQMASKLGLTQEAVAERLGTRRATVANHMRLLDLPESVQQGVTQGLLRMGHARALLGLKDEKAIISLFKVTVRKGLSVRQVEDRVRVLNEAAVPRTATEPAAARPAWVNDMESRIRERVGTKVLIKNREGYRGEITLQYHGREDLDRLLAHLAPPETI